MILYFVKQIINLMAKNRLSLKVLLLIFLIGLIPRLILFEAIFLNPSIEHQCDDFFHVHVGVVAEDRHFDQASAWVRGTYNDASHTWIFGPRCFLTFKRIFLEITSMIAFSEASKNY